MLATHFITNVVGDLGNQDYSDLNNQLLVICYTFRFEKNIFNFYSISGHLAKTNVSHIISLLSILNMSIKKYIDNAAVMTIINKLIKLKFKTPHLKNVNCTQIEKFPV